MNDTSAITEAPGGAVALIREAIASKADPAYLRELLAVREQWEAGEARKAFSAAIAEFQKRAPIVAKLDTAHNKQYARRDRIWREIRPLLTELGLSVTFQICELKDGLCHVEGMLRHRDGHGERIVQDIPLPQIIPGQNAAQQMGSATEYARRYATCSALGIVTGDDTDDDGHAAGVVPITAEQSESLYLKLEACRGLADWNEKAFWSWVGVGCAKDIPASRFGDVLAALNRKLGGVKK